MIMTAVIPLHVETLGRFAIWRGDDRLPDTSWGREKARQLFQYLITYRQRYTARERIIDDLWPELDANRADRDFKVALNAMNTALQPDRATRSLSAYIARQGASYGLDPDAPLAVDVDRFEAGLMAASQVEAQNRRQAIERYRPVLALYRGDYLPDALYNDWASAERERLTAIYLAAATRLARLLLAEGEIVEMLLWCQRVIAIDPCWEEAYRLLMRGHMATGNRPLALRAYQQCRAALIEELGIDPMNRTTRLYEEIKT
jgi:LuxR family transcriptional regulator, maltose regulon positive regulatory protein